MKKTNFIKTVLLLCALIVGSGNVWAAQSVVISSTPPNETTWTWFGTNRVTWNASVTWGASGAPSSATTSNSGYYQMGTQGNPASSIQFSTNDVVGRISSIVVNCASYNALGSISATVGGEAFGTQNQSVPKWASSTGGDVTFTKDGGATGAIVITMTNGASGRAMYIKSITVNYVAEASTSFAVEEFTETATINSDGTADSDGLCITTSGNTSSTAKFNYSYGLKFESKAGIITIALPANSTNAYVSLLNSAAITSLKLAGTTTNVTYTGDAENGYINTINIPDSYANSNFTIQKGSSGSPIIYKITLKYCLPSESKVLLYSSSNMEGWRTFYDDSQGYIPDANTKVYVVTSKSESTASLSEIDRIPSGTPVLLKTSAPISDDGVFKIALTKATVSEYTGTNLLAVTDGTDVTSKYRLGYLAGDGNGIGFYPYSATKPAAGIVYLDASSAASARGLTLDFGEGETTSISATLMNNDRMNNEVYNLNGQRVTNPTKGLFIVNGKKVIVK